MGRKPSLYAELFSDPIYVNTVVNTVIYLGIGVNLKMFGALLLSGFFMRRSWWTKGLLLIYVLPWAVPALPTFLSIHWMLNGQWGLLNNTLWDLFHIDGPGWLETSRWLALGSVIASHIWKWMPFWTVILLAGRMAIPQEVYDAAAIDGATGLQRFFYVTFPLLANLYLICTLLSTVFTWSAAAAQYWPCLSSFMSLGFATRMSQSGPAQWPWPPMQPLTCSVTIASVIWRCALVFAASGVAGAWVGSTLGKMVDGQRLLAAFAVLMMVVAGLMLRGRSGAENKAVHCNTETVLWLTGLGFATGAFSGFFGIGGGFLIVPAIVFATGMPIIVAIGSSLVAVALFGVTTAANYALSGAVDWVSAALLLLGGVFGGFLGTHAAHSLANHRSTLSNLFATGIFIVAVYMLVRTTYA